jgi:hypothetical protein
MLRMIPHHAAAADVSRRHLLYGKSAPTNVGGYTGVIYSAY